MLPTNSCRLGTAGKRPGISAAQWAFRVTAVRMALTVCWAASVSSRTAWRASWLRSGGTWAAVGSLLLLEFAGVAVVLPVLLLLSLPWVLSLGVEVRPELLHHCCSDSVSCWRPLEVAAQ
jgi:hypothetical protein